MSSPLEPGATLMRTAKATRANASVMRRGFRAWVADMAAPDVVDDLTLAVYEALANVVDHAYRTAAGVGQMRLRATVSRRFDGARDLVITVSDDGAWHGPTEPGGVRGRGLALMSTLTRASVVSEITGTTVSLRRRLVPAPA